LRITGINSYPNRLSFKRRLKEHRSWGATVDPQNKKVSFKILTFPDARSVDVKIYDESTGKFRTYPLKNEGNGIFESSKPLRKRQAADGDKYFYVITKKDGTTEAVKDPYARRQGNLESDDFLNYSIIYDNSNYLWQNQKSWLKSNKRIVRNPKRGGLGVESAIIYEMQIDTLTKEGTFDSAKEKLQAIKDLGFNTIEIMPNENTFSFNWGYDGVDKFAPPEHRGGPDKLKELIDYAHGLELNVVMDYVPNHLGPDGAQLKRTGPYVKGNNAFGEAFNFEGEDSKYVRDYIINAAINWADNYKVDGLRLDMTKFMESDFAMKQIAAEMNYHFPSVFLIAEDSRQGINTNDTDYFEDWSQLHDRRVVNPLDEDEVCGRKIKKHCRYIKGLDKTVTRFKRNGENYSPVLRNLGYDSEWDFSFHHALDDAVFTYNDTGALDKKKLESLMETIYQSQKNVKYVTSHDETGNRDGTRPVVKFIVPKLNLNSYMILNNEDKKRREDFADLKDTSIENARYTVLMQKAQLAAEGLVKLLVEGKLDSYRYKKYDEFYEDVLAKFNIRKDSKITYQRLLRSFETSCAQFRMAQALTYAIPGPKMVFQGDENLDMTSFRFFREFESVKDETYLRIEKGYEPGEPALMASKLGTIEYSDASKARMELHSNLTRDLNRLNSKNPALTKGTLALKEDGSRDCIIHNNVIGIHTKDEESGNEFYIATNFGNENYPDVLCGDYYMPFPKGEWVEVLNTDDVKYGGFGKYLNKGETFKGYGLYDDVGKTPIRLSGYSTVYFKRVG